MGSEHLSQWDSYTDPNVPPTSGTNALTPRPDSCVISLNIVFILTEGLGWGIGDDGIEGNEVRYVIYV